MYSVFRDLAIIILSAKFFALVARKCKAPQVVGEIIAGLIIGPCLLNLVQTSDAISIFAEIGVVLLMFSTGLGTNLKELMRAGPIATLIACVGVFVPLVGGTLLYSAFYGFAAVGSPEFYRALFIGTIMTATSVSITVATLQELGHLKSFLGTTIVSAAVIDDVIGIIVLTCVLGASSGEGTGIGGVLIQTVLFFLVAIGVGVVIHFAMKWLDKRNPHTQRITIVSMAFCFAMAYIAEQYFGIADITGAYIAGIVLCAMDDAPYVERRVDISNYVIFAPVHRLKDRHQRPDTGDFAVLHLLRHRCAADQDHRLRSGRENLPLQLGRFPQGRRRHDDPRRGRADRCPEGPGGRRCGPRVFHGGHPAHRGLVRCDAAGAEGSVHENAARAASEPNESVKSRVKCFVGVDACIDPRADASIRPYNQPAITKNPADAFKGVRRIYFYSASTASTSTA